MSHHRISVFACLVVCIASSVSFGGKLSSLRGKTRDSGGSKPVGKVTAAASASSPPKRDDSAKRREEAERRDRTEKREAQRREAQRAAERREREKRDARQRDEEQREARRKAERLQEARAAKEKEARNEARKEVHTPVVVAQANARSNNTRGGKLSSVRDRVRRPTAPKPQPVPAGPTVVDRPSRNRSPRGGRNHHDHRRPGRSGRRPSTFGFSFGQTFPTAPCPPTTIVRERFVYPTTLQTFADPYYEAGPQLNGPTGQPYFEEPILTAPTAPPVMPPSSEVIVSEAACMPCNETCTEGIVATEEWPINPYHIRFEIDYAGDEADVSRMGFGFLANVTRGIGVDTGVRLFRERDTDFRDHLWVGDFNITYELAASQFMRTRAGIGVNFLADWYGSDAGLNLTIGTDIFMGRLTLTGEADLGTLGDTDLFHGRVSAALKCDEHVETFVGYDFVDIGGVEFSGILAGLRFRY